MTPTDEQVERVARALLESFWFSDEKQAIRAARAAIAAMEPQVSPELIEKLGKLATYLTEQGEYEACDLIDTVVERVTKPASRLQGDGLAELRALSDVSSQGEWVLNTFNFKPEIKAGGNVIGFLRTHPDAAFIVACVNHVRAELERRGK